MPSLAGRAVGRVMKAAKRAGECQCASSQFAPQPKSALSGTDSG